MRQQSVQRAATRRESGVDSLPEGRAGGQRDQVRHVLHEQVDHADRRVAARHADVDVQAEHHALIGQPREAIADALVALVRERLRS